LVVILKMFLNFQKKKLPSTNRNKNVNIATTGGTHSGAKIHIHAQVITFANLNIISINVNSDKIPIDVCLGVPIVIV